MLFDNASGDKVTQISPFKKFVATGQIIKPDQLKRFLGLLASKTPVKTPGKTESGP